MRLDEAYWKARNHMGMPKDEFFDDEDWREDSFRKHAVGGLLAGMKEFPEVVEDGPSLLEIFGRLEHPAVERMIDACFQAAVVKSARYAAPCGECSGTTIEYILRDTFGNAFHRAVGVLDNEDDGELEAWAMKQVEWIAKNVDCDP